jgi:hypothetical protein
MSNIHHACDHEVLRTHSSAPAPWPSVLNVIVLLLDAFQKALEMRRAAHHKYPFREE